MKEAHVVLEIMAEVVDLPLEHGDSLDSHSEGEAAVDSRVDSGSLEDVRIYHAAAEDFEPASSFANVATLAMADVAAYVNLGRRLREREIGWTHTNLRIWTEHFAGEEQDGLSKVGESHVLVDIETFHLMEDAMCPC